MNRQKNLSKLEKEILMFIYPTSYFVVLFSGIEAILFGLGSIDRTWMPKADFNVLSWGYWLHVLGGFFAFISVVALFCNWYNSDDRLDEKDSYDEQGYND